ncbi:MAG: SAM hydrolase/SAM-dependent halogenase family protein [Acidiferrobacterales bacterium]
MILLYTDFGYADPYVGQMHRAIAQQNSNDQVIDLFHNAPVFNVKASSYLLPAYCPPIKNAVYCCVVDPGVGGDRAAVVLKVDDCHYIGPDNGLFEILARRYSAIVQEITWRPEDLSTSFHGRDLFAPVAARVAGGIEVEVRPAALGDFSAWPDELEEIVYVDHYGNLISGIRGESVSSEQRLEVAGLNIGYANTFSDLAVGGLFWYRNANGLVEIAANQGCAAELLGIGVGDPVLIKNNHYQ